MLDSILCLAALLALCVFFTSLPGVESATAPLLAIAGAMLYFALAGVLNVLVPAAWLFYILALGLLVFTVLRRSSLAFWKRFLSPGFMLFAGFSLVLLVYFALRQPLFAEWDEFTFWGTAVKMMKLDGRLYTTGNIGWFWTATQSPGLTVFSWFAQFFGRQFVAWKVFWAYDMVLLACVSALLAAFKLRRWHTAVPLAAVGLLTPFFFNVFYETVYLNTTYMSAYADLPAGMLFGGALAVYYSSRQAGRSALWQAALPVAALALVKDGNVLVMALVAAAIIAADTVLLGGAGHVALAAEGGKNAVLAPGAPRRRRVLLRLGAALCIVAVPLVLYMLWGGHAAWANAQNPVTAGAETGTSLGTALSLTLKELFGLVPQSAHFTSAAGNLWAAFLGHDADGAALQVSMLGSALITCLFILAIYALAIWLVGEKHARKRMGLAGGLLLLGLVGYHFVLLVFYAHMYKGGDVRPAVDYDRYLRSYLVGWFLLGVLFLALAARRSGGRALAGRCLVLVLAVFMLLRFGGMVRPGYSVLDYPESEMAPQREKQALADAISARVGQDARIFFVHQGGNGGEWFQYSYYLLPTVLDYSITGGSSLPPKDENRWWDKSANAAQQLDAYLHDSGCNYMLISRTNNSFKRHFKSLFADADGINTEDGPVLYRRGEGGLFEPVPIA